MKMSIKFKNDECFYICHETFLNDISVNEKIKYKSDLFSIVSTYSGNKNKSKQIENNDEFNDCIEEIKYVQTTYNTFLTELKQNNFLNYNNDSADLKNKKALELADYIYEESNKNCIKINTFGSNIGNSTIKKIENSHYFFPKNSRFYSCDISDIEKHLKDEKFDCILLDPPWWNKYIRRKRKKTNNAYDMLYNADLKSIPIDSLLNDNGIVVVWCTNSQQHLNDLLNNIFECWNVKYVAKWFWVKVTKKGEPVCQYSKPPGKQPYEKIIFGSKNMSEIKIDDKKLIVSVPSAIHSHKPPLVEILKEILPENAKCLEIFARYLLPDWTSLGNEVLKLQHESMFDFVE